MKFTKLYEDVKASDLFKPASPEEVAKRKEQYYVVKLNDILDSAKKTKLPDGTWHVHTNLIIAWCKLTTLENLNISITDGYVCCYKNELSNLKGAPTTVKSHFNCSNNKLTSLEGAPTTVYGDFNCNSNKLTSLEGAPKNVDEDFECDDNDKKFTKDEVRAVCDVKGGIYV